MGMGATIAAFEGAIFWAILILSALLSVSLT